MIDTHHDLHSKFPADGDILHALKIDNAHFRTLADQHENVSRTIYRIETDIEPASDARLEELKKERLALLDEVAGMIEARRNPPG